jgi:sarcosine oxidase subunit beta
MGTAIALCAARRLDPLADPVVLLERAELAAGSSGRSGAILRQFYADRELCAMARDSLREYAAFERKTGYSIGFRRSGVLALAGPHDPAARARVEANAATMRSVGVVVELLEAAEIRRRFPALSVADGSLAAYEPDGGFVDPRRTVRAFAAVARFHGATVREGEPVQRLVRDGGRIARVESARGAIEADTVVLAAGPWTRELLAELGIELPLQVLVPQQIFVESLPAPVGARGEASFAADPEAERFGAPREPAQPIAHPVVLDLEHGVYSRCEPDSARTRIGELDYQRARAIDSPGDFREGVDDAFSTWARAALARRIPAYAERPEVERQAAMYTVTPDTQAILGRVPGLENAFIATGFSGHGFKLAPSIGLGMTQLLLGDPVSAFDPAFFAPERFARPKARARGRFGI